MFEGKKRIYGGQTVFASVLADAIQRTRKDCKITNSPLIQRLFYLLNTQTICVTFFIIGCSVLIILVCYYKGIDAKYPAILRFFSVTARTQLMLRMHSTFKKMQ